MNITKPGGVFNLHFHVMAPIRPIEKNGEWGCKQHRVYELEEDNRFRNADGPVSDKDSRSCGVIVAPVCILMAPVPESSARQRKRVFK